ncbi:ABC transporter ATP-binding protein [Aeromicrobium sp.]|uniref:ABC transporter ATP-binding protein n=1 Tax=Aeromicrobium sp. TaxID=1871063 RepID=UPI003D6B0DC7
MTDTDSSLSVENVTVKFGGVTALDDVSFTVEPGTIHALIGPNGAGKSTCFNVVSGLYEATSGRVMYGSEEVTGRRPHTLVRLGIGRAFQNVALSPHGTVVDNVMLGRHALTSGGFLRAGLRALGIRGEQARHRERAVEICEFLGLGAHLDRPIEDLSYGDSKRVDVARALATEPSILLLDEPAAGMNAGETAIIAQAIVDIRDALDISILLVEHDMSLVMGIADHVSVLDFGSLISDGTPERVRLDPQVIRAYLGGEVDPSSSLAGPAENGPES